MPCEGCYHISRNIQLDACIITANRTEMLRNVEIPNQRVQKERDYKFRRGTTAATAWKKEDIQKLIIASILTELRFKKIYQQYLIYIWFGELYSSRSESSLTMLQVEAWKLNPRVIFFFSLQSNITLLLCYNCVYVSLYIYNFAVEIEGLDLSNGEETFSRPTLPVSTWKLVNFFPISKSSNNF